MEVEELREQVAKVGWFHRIDLGNGIITPGRDDSPSKLTKLGMPADLRGMTVLDIGAADGFFSFEAERRGAERVLSLDEDPGSLVRFEFAKSALRSKVERRQMDLMGISKEKIGTFDLVLFLGVLYHLPHPLLGIERVYSVTQGQLILETHVDQVWNARPLMVFYPGSELNNDPTNWWGPNAAAVEAMLRTVGFRTVKRVGLTRSLVRRMGSALKWRIKRKVPLSHTVQHNRAVFHAWR
jgi:tRNA (mo5U34)-methyltransferase